MASIVDYREEYNFTLVPERAALFHRWADYHNVSPQELFLDVLALGVAWAISLEFGEEPPPAGRARDAAYQEQLLDALEEQLGVWTGAVPEVRSDDGP